MKLGKKILWLLVAVNIAAIAISITQYYQWQLASTAQENIFLLPFVPDCPLATFFVMLSIILIYYFKKNIAWFYFLSFSFALKSALWTIAVSVFYSPFPLLESGTLLIIAAHLGLLAETALIAGRLKVRGALIAVPIAWLLLNDFVDYFLGTHPPVFIEGITQIFLLSLALSAFSLVFTFVLGSRGNRAPAKIKGFFKKII